VTLPVLFRPSLYGETISVIDSRHWAFHFGCHHFVCIFQGNGKLFTFRTTLTTQNRRAGFANFQVDITLRISTNAVIVENSTIAPNSMKMDVQINNWPWKSTGGTRLALVMLVGSATKMSPARPVPAQNATSTLGEDGAPIGTDGSVLWVTKGQALDKKTWFNITAAPFALASASDLSLQSGDDDGNDDDNQSGEQAQLIAFTFAADNQPSQLYWDPTMVANDATLDAAPLSQPSAAVSVQSTSMVLVVLLAAAIAAVMGF
jgi:hypothetical protein